MEPSHQGTLRCTERVGTVRYQLFCCYDNCFTVQPCQAPGLTALPADVCWSQECATCISYRYRFNSADYRGWWSTNETEAQEVKDLARVPHWDVLSEVDCCISGPPFSSLFLLWHFLFTDAVTAQMLALPQHSQSSLALPTECIPFFPSV